MQALTARTFTLFTFKRVRIPMQKKTSPAKPEGKRAGVRAIA
jgi:hypothetical protein